MMKPMRPSPAIVIAILGLVSAVAGTAIAGPGATISKLTRGKVAKIADTEINKLAPGLSVATAQQATNAQNAINAQNAQNAINAQNATNSQNAQNATNAQNAATAQNANTVDGLSAADLQASFAFDQDTTVIPSLSEGGVAVARATITTQGFGVVMASGSAELTGADSGERGACWIQIDDQASARYDSDPDDIGTNSKTVIAVNFARTLFEGPHTVGLFCAAVIGVVGKEDAAINVHGIPIPPQ